MIFYWLIFDIDITAIFEPFLRAYYEKFKYQSIDSYQFKEFFLDYFKDKDTSSINWDQWFYTPGMPKYKPNFDESLAKVSHWIEKFFLIVMNYIINILYQPTGR